VLDTGVAVACALPAAVVTLARSSWYFRHSGPCPDLPVANPVANDPKRAAASKSGSLRSGRRKLIEDGAGKGGREAPARNLMPQAGHKPADVSWDFRRERRKRGHRHRLFIAEAGEHT
jgi:hypothetical protein